jgi:hypothetical protein
MNTRPPRPDEVCQIDGCGQPATITVVTDIGDCPFCAKHHELCWDTIPKMLAEITLILFGGK